ncbi:putative nuclease HARBI1 [Aphis gossypii]|uniref:putative nuclease HARBI1 n=1 Tax=Aphis gossypii TaxID=80765 RepID=UPI002159B146|nr:putative nuclease HARBI1 [Aphis gossypii]
MFKSSPFYPKSDQAMVTARSAELHVLSFLWFASNKCDLRDVASRFGLSLSSQFRINDRVMEFLIKIAPSIIKMPKSDAEKESVAKDFKMIALIPHALGCIDSTSITIRTPKHKVKSTYVNRHDIPAITLQGICDSKKRFLDAFTGPPGKIHDARVLKLSGVLDWLPRLCNEKYYLLGDGAYPLRQWLITPYRNIGHFTESQKHFNKKFSATRVKIENTFGLLKGRFRQLTQIDMHEVNKITKFIICCCVMHNLCIYNDDLINYNEYDNEEVIMTDEYVQDITVTDVQLKLAGESKRNNLKEYLLYLNN